MPGFFRGKDVSLPTYNSPEKASQGKFSRLAGLPMAPFSPTGDATPSKYQKRRKQGLSLMTYILTVMGSFNIIMTVSWKRTNNQFRSLLESMDARDAQDVIFKVHMKANEITAASHSIEKSVQDVERKFGDRILQLHSENQRYHNEIHDLKLLPDRIEATKRREKREPEFLLQIQRMEHAIRKESKRSVLEKYGIGPHHVQFTYEWKGTDYDFEIELAPLPVVPHAIHLFLEQVEHGLWNNTVFYSNTDHVLQLGAIEVEEEGGGVYHGERWEAFENEHLQYLAFPDYSPLYPHTPWTIGFAGRPGGPDWFINKVDNSNSHGPGGQTQHGLKEQGDSCFGRIIRGREYLETFLFPLPTTGKGDFPSLMIEPVVIKHAILLTPKPGAETAINMADVPDPPTPTPSAATVAVQQDPPPVASDPVEQQTA